MNQLAKINLETGMFIEDAIIDGIPMILNWPTDEEGNPIQPEVTEGEEVPPMYVPDPQYKAPPRQGIDYTYWPKWDFETGGWTEGSTAPESAMPEPTEVECLQCQLAQTNADIQAFMDYYFTINPE